MGKRGKAKLSMSRSLEQCYSTARGMDALSECAVDTKHCNLQTLIHLSRPSTQPVDAWMNY